MNLKNKFFALLEVVLWYFFTYYALYAVKNPVQIGRSAAILVALAYGAAVACPILRNSSAWRRAYGNS